MNNKPLKILYLITKSNFGGAQRYVYDLATHAQSGGHDVLVGFGGDGSLKMRLDEKDVRTISIDSLGRDVSPLRDIKSFLTLLALFQTEKPDIVHINSSKIGGLGSLAGRIWNGWAWVAQGTGHKSIRPMRIIFTGHAWAFNEERSDIGRFLIGVLHWTTVQLAHTTIAVSRRTRNQVMLLPFVWNKLRVVHNGVGPQQLLPKTDAEIVLGLPHRDEHDGSLRVGTLAELHKNKGLSYSVNAIALIKKQRPDLKITFTIIGEGEERANLEALITTLKLEDMVRLVGYKENGATLLSAFDVFLLPSTTEAFPYAVLEAGRAGLPVIATSVGGIPEIIDDMQSGILIQSKNPSEVARAILYLVDNPKRRTGLGEALLHRTRDRFSVEQMVEQTFALYNENA